MKMAMQSHHFGDDEVVLGLVEERFEADDVVVLAQLQKLDLNRRLGRSEHRTCNTRNEERQKNNTVN